MGLWRVEQAAQFLGIRPKTLYDWVRRGRVPHRKLGFNVRFDPQELERWAAAQVPPDTGKQSGTGDRALQELCEAAAAAAKRLGSLEAEVGTQLSFPQRQALRNLADRLCAALERVNVR